MAVLWSLALIRRNTVLPIEKNWRSQNFSFPSFKKFVFRLVFGELRLTQIPLHFQTSCCILRIRGMRKKQSDAFSIYVSFLRYFILNQFFHVKRRYWLKFMMEKQSGKERYWPSTTEKRCSALKHGNWRYILRSRNKS